MTLLMLPVICTEEAMKDALFKKGYLAHIRALQAMKDGHTFANTDYDICISAYSDSYEKFETPESIANILWWFLITEVSVKNQWMVEGAKALNDKCVSNGDFFKRFYLKDCSFQDEQGLPEDIEKKDLDELEEAIIELLKELKKNSQYVALADYYMALRYVLGCVNNDLTEAMNKAVGAEMMWAFAQFGNMYAKNFILKGIENSRK